MTRKIVVIAVVLAALALAGPPVATVSTSGSLVLNGTAVPNAGVVNWPVAAGDEIATSTAPAVIVFRDGTQISMSKSSRVRLHKTGLPGVNLLTGSAAYKTPAAAKLNMQALGRAVDLHSRTEGVISIQGSDKVVVSDKSRDDEAASKAKKPKKPQPRSGHKDDDEGDDR